MTATRRWTLWLLGWCAPLFLFAAAGAQSVPLQRTFPRSKSDVEKALRDLHAYSGGRLPILDGFVAGEQPLEHYQRPYYQYSVQVTSPDGAATIVQVSARITAWYAGESAAHSGYRVLPSDGRLETDLLDRLSEALGVKTDEAQEPVPARPSTSDPETHSFPAAASSATAPDQPAAAVLPHPRFGRTELPSRSSAAASQPPKDSRPIQQLSDEAKNLEEILQHQSRPDNLAAVKSARTPVLERPEDGANALFLADAEDEFQIVDTNGPWVHVQISGLSRGWIRREALQLPPAYDSPVPVSATEATLPSPFRQTRQETAAFPGTWQPLRGKQVKVIWVQPAGSDASGADKFSYAKSVFRKAFPELLHSAPPLAGVVIVFDSQDGGMAAATLATLQQWNAHHMTDNIFWKQCWFDPADAFKLKD